MISKNNKEIRITLPKPQATWLEKTCKKAGISKSQYISWILIRKAEEMVKVLHQKTDLTEEEVKELIKELERIK